ncbi:MAG: hypothetical protein SOW59_03275 [Corynebacterium sp.]|nr:hypothetical protein [Corynebacterium sp.]
MSDSVISLRIDTQQKEHLDSLATEAEAARKGELETISIEDLETECGLVN